MVLRYRGHEISWKHAIVLFVFFLCIITLIFGMLYFGVMYVTNSQSIAIVIVCASFKTIWNMLMDDLHALFPLPHIRRWCDFNPKFRLYMPMKTMYFDSKH
jgi:hypothetical protein